MKFKVVINTCYGGFGLSDEAWRKLATRTGLSIEEAKDQYIYLGSKIDGARSCPHLIAVVEKLGDKANDLGSELEIVELEDEYGRYAIDEYDGAENVFTPAQQTWHIALNKSCNEGD